MRVAVIGASGWLGGSIAREALDRGLDVTVIGRDETKLVELASLGAHVRVADLDDRSSIKAAVTGVDVVVSSVTDRTTEDRSRVITTARLLLELLPEVDVPRVAFVGGGGSLEVSPGLRFVDSPGFPEAYRNEAMAQGEVLDLLRTSDTSLVWTYMSPPPHYLSPGPRSGRYRVAAGDLPVNGPDGESRLTSGDFASAFVDELTENRFAGQRFSAGEVGEATA